MPVPIAEIYFTQQFFYQLAPFVRFDEGCRDGEAARFLGQEEDGPRGLRNRATKIIRRPLGLDAPSQICGRGRRKVEFVESCAVGRIGRN